MMELSSYLSEYKKQSLQALDLISEDEVAVLIDCLREARDQGKQVFVCGNGGSAATASHFANDLGKGASLLGSNRFRVISLTDNIPWITALANDIEYSSIFVEQMRNFAMEGDVLLAISGSGNSKNVLEAVRWANENGLVSIGLTGRPGGELGKLAQNAVFVESSHMGRIEEGHFLIQHMIGYYFMEVNDESK
jgi:D-sedoheptulose 7-phosphate isomerase